MAISPIVFGSNLRPSVVTNIKKINEVIEGLNEVDPDSVTTLKTDVSTLKQNMTQVQNDIVANKNSITELSTTLSSALEDITKIKTTLYTPLGTDE